MRQYKVLLPLKVHTADGAYDQYEIFAKEFSEEDEAANVASGLLELQPQRYKALSDNLIFAPEGEEFEAALPLGQEIALVAGGHIELLDDEPKPVKPARKKKEKVA